MKHLCLLLFICTLPVLFIHGQKFRVATWNLENAFDTVHDIGKDDLEFTPNAERRWHSGRYWRKLKGITQTLAAMELPSLVGLQEVENDTVLRDLTRRTALWSVRYRYLITDSPDNRGIDVALLYNPSVFSLLTWQTIRIPSIEHGLTPTRDILVASGMVGKDTLHVCVVHLPSRRNDNLPTRKNRTLAVKTLCNILDSLAGQKVMVMGDFNAEPSDKIFTLLSSCLYSLTPSGKDVRNERRGTYYFRGIWGYLDHILISPELLALSCGKASECRFPWLLRTAKEIPHRTYGGTNYIGGLSDHLPLTADFRLNP